MIGIVLLGAPGSGKGTQAKRLQLDLHIPHISTGDTLRREIDRGSELGLRVKDILASGKLVDDELMGEIIKERFSQDDVKKGFVLDGYPRTTAQAELLDGIFKSKGFPPAKAVQIDLPKNELLNRLVGRLSCTKCGASFHRTLNRPKKDSLCDVCGSALIQRKDDSESTVGKRLEVYEKETAVLLDYYKKQGQLKAVDGLQAMEKLTADIKKALGV
jgi:adenylate kinase